MSEEKKQETKTKRISKKLQWDYHHTIFYP